MRNSKSEKVFLEIALAREQKELFAHIQTEFWQALFCDILKKHTYQNDFYLVEKDLTLERVIGHMRETFYDLCHVYGFELVSTSHPYKTELKLLFDYYDYNNQKRSIDELSIIICQKDITMRMLPHNPLLKLFWLEEYGLVEIIVKALCEQLFNERKEQFSTLHKNYKKIQSSSNGLTLKTIEIAQNSIKTLYESSGEKNRNLVQRNLYSSLLYKGRMIRIFHKDFLENPNVLLKEFEK